MSTIGQRNVGALPKARAVIHIEPRRDLVEHACHVPPLDPRRRKCAQQDAILQPLLLRGAQLEDVQHLFDALYDEGVDIRSYAITYRQCATAQMISLHGLRRRAVRRQLGRAHLAFAPRGSRTVAPKY